MNKLKLYFCIFSYLFMAGCAAIQQKQGSGVGTIPSGPDYSESRILYGEKNSPITIFRYVDMRSIFDSVDMQSTIKLLNNYKTKVKMVVKHVPLTHLHPPAFVGAQIVEALLMVDASLARAFYEKALEKDVLLSINSGDDYWKLAKKMNMPIEKIKSKIAQGNVDYNILNDYAEFTRLRLTGTPTYVIDRDILVGARPYEELEEFLKKHLN